MKLAICVLAFVALTSSARCEEMSVPLAVVDDVPFVEVKLEGSRPLSFVVDTGSTRMVVDEKTSRKLHLQEAENDSIGGAGSGRISVRKIHDLGGAQLQHVEFISADLSAASKLLGHAVDGILGYEFLSRYIVTVDYANRQMRFAPPPDVVRARGDELPLRIEKGWAFVRAAVQVEGSDEIKDEFLIDSGSSDAVDHPLAARAVDRAAAQTGRGLGAPVAGFIATAKTFRIGSHTLHDVGIASGGGTAATSKLIGGGVLSKFTVTFDYPHAWIFLAPRE